jgi:magnesium-protoporphyrin O-methyltransferase
MFGDRAVRRELRRYRKRGPGVSTSALLGLIEAAEPPRGATLLDIGGGIGGIHHRLLDHGFSNATHVDASHAYLAAARDETARRGHEGRVTFREGDFADATAELPEFDVVTLDRVVCCDPDFTLMLTSAATRARRMVAFTYPRPRRIIRWAIHGMNVFQRLSRSSFRAYVHDPSAMAAVLERNGLRRSSAGGTWIWAAVVFER